MGTPHRLAVDRSLTRTLIVLLAALSLIATQFAGFGLSAANADQANGTIEGFIEFTEVGDPDSKYTYQIDVETNGADITIPGIRWDPGNTSAPDFHLSCSATLLDTTATVDLDFGAPIDPELSELWATETELVITNFDTSRVTNGGKVQACDPGSFGSTITVVKVVEGDDKPADDPTYDFALACDSGANDEVFGLKDGESKVLVVIPDTDCTVEETADNDADSTTWAITEDVIAAGDDLETDPFDIGQGQDETVTVTFTNTFNTTPPPPPPPPPPASASLTVVKDVVGPAPEGAEFGFDVVCDTVTLDTFTLEADGTNTTTGITGGSTCTVEETDTVGADATSWAVTGDVTDAGTGEMTESFVLAAGDSATVTFTNQYPEVAGQVFEPAISLVKTALIDPDENGDKIAVVNDDGVAEITYEYTITNTGDVDLGGITLDDNVIGGLTDDLEVTSLAVGESTTVEVPYTTTSDQLDAGEVVNVATTTGTDEQGTTVSDTDDETVLLAEVLAEAEALPEIAETGADATVLTTLGLLLAAVGAFALRMTPSGARRR